MISNKQARKLIEEGSVDVDGVTVHENCAINSWSEIKVNGKIVRPAKIFAYYRFYKPTGYQSSLNEHVENNISVFFKEHNDLAIAGRLDKHSEGLLLLSNYGIWVENLCNPKFEKEKEYLVELDQIPDEAFFEAFKRGVKIGPYFTKPCLCEHVNGSIIRVTLTEGKNRQIRKMCKSLGYSVISLKRIRIDGLLLDNLQSGEKQLFRP